MTQYAATLDLSSLNGTNGFQLTGGAGQFGTSVASAGDVNNDGFDDLIVGGWGANLDGLFSTASQGASYFVYGGTGFTSTLDVSALDGSDGYRIVGHGGDGSGWSVSAGDINGDGNDDLIIGAAFADPGGSNSGAFYVVFGDDDFDGLDNNDLTSDGLVHLYVDDVLQLNGSNGFMVEGIDDDDAIGQSIASVGDINGDGYDDIGVSDMDGDSGYGAFYVVFGAASGFGSTLSLSALDGTNGFKLEGEAVSSRGAAIDAAGDVNGDGFVDLIVGNANANTYGTASGASYVVFGTDQGFGATVDLSALDGNDGFRINAEQSGEKSGTSVASAGDVNGDGFADLIVGAPNGQPYAPNVAGLCYVVFGTNQGFDAELDLSSLDGDNGFRLNGVSGGDETGYSVSSAGDFNGDGFADLIVGLDIESGYGACYVVFGKASGFGAELDLDSLDGNNGFQINGEEMGDHAGSDVSSAGDINGDGFSDLVVGAKAGNGQAGNAYVLFGSAPGEAVSRTGTDIANVIYGSDFADTLTGAGGDDTLYGLAGADNLYGGTEDDHIYGGDDGDTIGGGDGSDTISGGVGNDTISGNSGDDTIDGNNGTDSLSGSVGNDVLTGNGGNDTLNGGGNADVLDGGSGSDTFLYGGGGESNGNNYDTVRGADFSSADRFDITSTVSAIDATVTSGQLRNGHFDSDMATAVNAALGVGHAILFTPTSGNLSGKTFLVVDLNSDGVYNASPNDDLVVELVNPVNLGSLDTADFI